MSNTMYIRDEENFIFIVTTGSRFDKNDTHFNYLNNPITLIPWIYCIHEKNYNYNLEKAIEHFKDIRGYVVQYPIYVFKHNWMYVINNNNYIMEKTDRSIELMPFDNDDFVRKFKEKYK